MIPTDYPIERVLKNLNLNHLLYFHTVADSGSLTKAAKKLNITQPTLSQQIMKLEESIAKPLFSREGRSVQLTEFGQSLYAKTEIIFPQIKTMVLEMHYKKQQSFAKSLSLGILPSVPSGLIETFLKTENIIDSTVDVFKWTNGAIHSQNPDVLICDEDLDMAHRPQGLIFEKTIHSPEVFLVAMNQSFHVNANLTDVIGSLPYIKLKSSHPFQPLVDQFFHNQDFQPKVIGEADDFENCSTLLNTFPSFSILPDIAIQKLAGASVYLKKVEDFPELKYKAYYSEKFRNEWLATSH